MNTNWFITWITATIESLGYVGVAILIALENYAAIISSEAVLPLVGYLSAKGQL